MELKNYSTGELISEIKRLKTKCDILDTERIKNIDTIKTLIAKISHEFKTPLNSIIGFSELIKYKTDDIKVLNYSKNILKSSEHMLSLVQDIIDISNTQNKPLELDYSIFSAKKAIEEVIKSFNIKNINSLLIDITICADYTRFKQLIYNLLSNAVKFSNSTKIDIITYTEENKFCFEITDYGELIKKEDYKKIFDLFVQVSENYRNKKKGSGIGLSLCKTIAESHGGTITVKSGIKTGTTFIFKLPIEFKKD